MSRNHKNNKKINDMITEELIQQVWDRTVIPVENYDPAFIGSDCCGALIVRSEYGNTNSQFGWEIDHVYPQSAGGDDYIDNLRAMHWQNNRAKGDDFPVYKIAVRAQESVNMPIDKQLRVNDDLYQTLKNHYNF